jgi:hypothetical protein
VPGRTFVVRNGVGKECRQMRHITLIATVAALTVAVAPAFAVKGGNGNGGGTGTASAASCAVDGNVVSGSGLPTWTLLNFMITDSSGTHGWVLGYSGDGTAAVSVPSHSGRTTYEFVGETRGRDGSRYDVYASCSA